MGAFVTVVLPPPHNLLGTNYDDANIDFSSQHDVSATWKLEGWGNLELWFAGQVSSAS